jgi:cyclophilin family peptidyl-prolyl cis-trans isomerase
MRTAFLLLSACLLWLPAQAAEQARVDTSMGTIVVALDAEKAPASVANFVRYAKEGHFNGTLFYRVVSGYVLQAGSYGADHVWRPTHKAIPLESANGLHNVKGAVAMAREDAPASATAEFFIDLDDVNVALDPKPADAPNTTGYAVFGHVVEGIDVVDAIAAVPVGGNDKAPFPGKEPLTPVVIKKVTIVTVPDPVPAPVTAPAPVAAPAPAPAQ